MATIRLTMAQAIVRYLANQYTVVDGEEVPYFAGVWAIFGHGNVAGMGEALEQAGDTLPTFRAHNEQGMAHAAIAFAKTSQRRRAMVCTTSIGPGATNMVTASALAHVNRLPVLFLPGDVFAGRQPDPVLQQIEDFDDGTVSANDCFRPVSRYFDRLSRPEQILTALPRVMATFMDPSRCGPSTLALCQDTQAEAYDYPERFFDRHVWWPLCPAASAADVSALVAALRQSNAPLIVAGGGVHYAGAADRLARLAGQTAIPVAETQAGKSALAWDHPANLGSIGVTGTAAANAAANRADLIIAIGTRLQDFTTGSRALFQHPDRHLIQVNVASHDAWKHGATAIVADAACLLTALEIALGDYHVPDAWRREYMASREQWLALADVHLRDDARALPSDAQVVGAVNRATDERALVVCAAGGLPGELHKLWRASRPGGYHVEYGYSCMGYEIAGGIGVKLAAPDRDVIVMVGDGSYLMMNSEIATAAMMGVDLTLVVLDNGGFGCINRLQKNVGAAPFNNLLQDARHIVPLAIDFVAHAQSLGARAVKATSIADLERALASRRGESGVHVIVIDTDPDHSTPDGGAWWDVAVPEISARPQVNEARRAYEAAKQSQQIDR